MKKTSVFSADMHTIFLKKIIRKTVRLGDRYNACIIIDCEFLLSLKS